MSIGPRAALLGLALAATACSLDGLADGRASTGTGGKGTSSAMSSSSTGTPKPHMFTWALDLGPTPANGALHLAPSGSGVVIATSGAQVSLSHAACGSDACVAAIDASGNATAFADGIGGGATKTVTGVAASADRVAVVGTFAGSQPITFGSGPSAVSFTGTSKTSAFVVTFDATSTKLVHAARLRSLDATMAPAPLTVTAVAVDASDNVYVTGTYRDTILYSPPGGPEVTLTGLSSGVGAQGFVLKLTAALSPDWRVDFGTTGDAEEGTALDVGPTGVVAFGGLSHAPATLTNAATMASKSCVAHYAQITGVMAIVGFVDPTGAPIQCDSFGGYNSDVAAIVATSAGALFGGRYTNALTWPALPSPSGQKFGYVFDQWLPGPNTPATPASQVIYGDPTSFHELNAMAVSNGMLYLGATTNGSPSFKTDGSCAFPILGNDDGLVAVEPKMPNGPFAQPKGLIIGSPNRESIDALAVTSAGGIVVGGIYTSAFDLLPSPMMVGATDRYVGLVSSARLAAPCP